MPPRPGKPTAAHLSAADAKLLQPPTQTIRDAAWEAANYAAWQAHLGHPQPHGLAFILCARQTMRRAQQRMAAAMEAQPGGSGLARCWCSGCEVRVGSVADMLRHQAHFHHLELADTNWLKVQVCVTALGCCCHFTGTVGSKFIL
jgi:hypothetical protein